MLNISRMKSLFTPTKLYNCSLFFHSQNPILFHKTTTKLKPHYPFQTSSLSIVNSLSNCSKPSKKSFHTKTGGTNGGQIHVIVGPMFAGKTTTLLKRIKLATNNGSSVVVIKSDKDNRYGLECIVTHDGEKLPCVPLADLSSLRDKFGPDAYDKVEVIGIDEAQFFGDLYDFCSKAADHDGKTVIVAGLDGDYLRRTFGSVLDIIPIADSVTKLTARCEVCGGHAPFTLRKTDETRTEVIAGADVYMPVCRKHYINGQMVKDTTKAVLESQASLVT